MKDLSYFQNLYIQTAYDYLNNMKNDIATLLNDPQNNEAITDMHIAAHSLKSQSYAMNYQQTANLAFALEKIFEKIKTGKNTVSSSMCEAVTDSVNKLIQSIDTIKNENKEIGLKEQIEKLEKLQ